MITEFDFAYCPKCAGEFRVVGEKNLLVCQNCDLHYYISPRPCNAIILVNPNNEILLITRKRDPKKGWWDLPGGFVDIHESLEDSMRREAREELKIDLKDFSYFTSAYNSYEYRGLKVETVGAIFLGKMSHENIQPSDDASDYKFFAIDQIPFGNIAFEVVEKALKQYVEKYS